MGTAISFEVGQMQGLRDLPQTPTEMGQQCPCTHRSEGKGSWGLLIGRWAAAFHTSTGWLFQANSKVIVSRDANSSIQNQEGFFNSDLSVIWLIEQIEPKICPWFYAKSLPEHLPTYCFLHSQVTCSSRPHPGYRTDLDHKHFGTRSSCTYNNISMLVLRGDLEVCCIICSNIKLCLECQTHAFWIKDKPGFCSHRASPHLPPLCGDATHRLWTAGYWGSNPQPSYGSPYGITTCWLRCSNCPSAHSPCKASRSWTHLHGKLSWCEWPHIWLPWLTLNLITLLNCSVVLWP